jgi:hypothetical protein
MTKRKVKTPSSAVPAPVPNDRLKSEEKQPTSVSDPSASYANAFHALGSVFRAFFAGIAWCFNNIHQLMVTAFTLWIFILLYITGHVILKAQGYL